MDITFSSLPLFKNQKAVFLDTGIISDMTKVKLGLISSPKHEEIYNLLISKVKEGKISCINAMQSDELMWHDRYDAFMALLEGLSQPITVLRSNMLEQLHIIVAMKAYIQKSSKVILPASEEDMDPMFYGLGVETYRLNTRDNKNKLRDGLLDIRLQGRSFQEQLEEEITTIPRMVTEFGIELARKNLSTEELASILLQATYPGSLLLSWSRLCAQFGSGEDCKIMDFFQSSYFRELPTIKISSNLMAKDITDATGPKQLESGPYDIMHAVYALMFSDYALIENKMANRMNQGKLNYRDNKIYGLEDSVDFIDELAKL